jgi:hypothetical protein
MVVVFMMHPGIYSHDNMRDISGISSKNVEEMDGGCVHTQMIPTEKFHPFCRHAV